ncbi:hypothetical protein IQ238_29200 [Pleurocapsales cyanobacterium LEGE 06147]|nr:hypothetical protein [Pleurocapsales cyanobacterium LEGE 06147]
MPDLTLAQRFGTNVTIDTSVANNPKLVITLKDLQDSTNGGDILNGLGIDDATVINDTNKDQWASAILHALVLLSFQKQPTNNNDPTVAIYITNGGKRFLTRDSVNQVEFRLIAAAYKNDSQGLFVDPDDLA